MDLNVTGRLESMQICSGVDYTFNGELELTNKPFRNIYMYCKREACKGMKPCIKSVDFSWPLQSLFTINTQYCGCPFRTCCSPNEMFNKKSQCDRMPEDDRKRFYEMNVFDGLAEGELSLDNFEKASKLARNVCPRGEL